MRLINTRQIDANEVFPEPGFDAFIAASGYEERATYTLTTLPVASIPRKIAFGFGDRTTGRRKINDTIFDSADVNVVPVDGNSGSAVRAHIVALLDDITSETPRIFVDYSSMTRAWYAGIIEAIAAVKNKTSVTCVFGYSPASYSPPSNPTPNAIAGPIAGFCSLDVPDKPSALIIGLGYERERALGILEYIDPAVAFAFYTDPAIDERYTACVVQNNRGLLELLGRDRIFRHPLSDLQRAGSLLVSLYSALADDYRVILAPLGVKPFSLLCLLLASRFLDVDVWRVTAGERGPIHVREPAGPILMLRADFAES
jgi:hypothetical protein